MNYSISYIMKIAEFKFGKGDKKAIDEYIEKFDPTKPEFIADLKDFESFSKNDEDVKRENKVRYRLLQDVAYLSVAYGRYYYDAYGAFYTQADKKKVKQEDVYACDPFSLTSVIIDKEFKADDNIHYHRYIAEIQRKYGFHHDPENVISVLKGIAPEDNANEAYKSYFKMLFMITLCEAKKKDDCDMMEVFTDLENMMNDILKTEIATLDGNKINIDAMKHAGMQGAELIEFFEECNKTFSAEVISADFSQEIKETVRRESINVRLSMGESSKPSDVKTEEPDLSADVHSGK